MHDMKQKSPGVPPEQGSLHAALTLGEVDATPAQEERPGFFVSCHAFFRSPRSALFQLVGRAASPTRLCNQEKIRKVCRSAYEVTRVRDSCIFYQQRFHLHG